MLFWYFLKVSAFAEGMSLVLTFVLCMKHSVLHTNITKNNLLCVVGSDADCQNYWRGSSMGSTNFDVIVIGAGIEGSASAYHLAKEGQRTLLLEQVRMFCYIWCYSKFCHHHIHIIAVISSFMLQRLILLFAATVLCVCVCVCVE